MVPPAAPSCSQDTPQCIGPYTVTATLGGGGQSRVFAGKINVAAPTGAIKWSRQQFDPPWSDPLANEFRLLHSLRHPQLTRTHDFGYADKRAYMVVDAVNGPSLFAGISVTGIAGFWLLVRAVAPVIDFLHHRGIIHRDLKPDNFRWAGATEEVPGPEAILPVYLLDLGLVAETEGDVTKKQAGTLRYMAPEVLQIDDYDQRSDLYSLGIIFYEWLTGNPPFVNDDPATVIDAHLTADITWPTHLVHSDVGPVLALVESLLARNPDDRPVSIAEFIERCRAVGMLVPKDYPREVNIPWHLQSTAIAHPKIKPQSLVGERTGPTTNIALGGPKGCGVDSLLLRFQAECKIRGQGSDASYPQVRIGDCRIADVSGSESTKDAVTCTHCLLPLDTAGVRDFLTRVFFDESFVSQIESELHLLSSGLPGVVTRIIELSLKNGVITRQTGHWQLTDSLAEHVAGDPVIRDIYQDFFKDVSDEQRRVISFAAVSGSSFSRAVVEELLQADQGRVETLEELFAAGIFVAETTREESPIDSRFRLPGAAVIWEADLPPEHRRVLHQKTAALLQGKQESWGTAVQKHLAIHHWHAEEYRPAYTAAVAWAKHNATPENASEAGTFLDLAEDAAKQLSSVDRFVLQGRVQMLRGVIDKAQGQHEASRRHLLQAMIVARATGDIRLKAESAKHLGDTYKATREHTKSGRVLKIALRHFRILNDEMEISHTLNNLGNAAFYGQQWDTAQECYTQAFEIQHRLNLIEAMSSTLSNLGTIHICRYQLSQAQEVLTDALSLMEQLKKPSEIARTLANLGALSILAGDYTKAIEQTNQAIEVNEQLKAGNEVLLCLSNKLEAYLWQGNGDRVIMEGPKVLERAESLKNRLYQTHVQVHLGRAHFHRGEYDRAERYLSLAGEHIASINEPILAMEYHLLRARLRFVYRDKERCNLALAAALEAVREGGDLRGEAEVCLQASVVEQGLGELSPAFFAADEEARRLFEKSSGKHRIFELLLETDAADLHGFQTTFPDAIITPDTLESEYRGPEGLEGLWLRAWARKFQIENDQHSALRLLERLVQWADDGDRREYSWRAWTELGGLYDRRHDYESAAQAWGNALQTLEEVAKSIPTDADRTAYLADPMVRQLNENLAAFAAKFKA